MKVRRIALLMMLVLGVTALSGMAKVKPEDVFSTEQGVALNGYDVVGYHTQYLAIRGTAEHAATHDGVTYHFSSGENLQTFKKDPEKYLPEYGGWCAFAMGAKNAKFAPDPKTFKMVNGKLYVFYNGEHGNTIVPWNADESKVTKEADKNWTAMTR